MPDSSPKLNRNSCQLNEEGKALLNALILRAYPQGRPSFVGMAGDFNVGRELISNLIQGKDRGFQAGKIAIVFEKLWSRSGPHLTKEGKPVPCPFEAGTHCQNYLAPSIASPPQPPKVNARPDEKNLNEALLNFDCVNQQSCVDQLWGSCKRTSLITIHAHGSKTQRWLVKRFARKVPILSQAKIFPIKFKAHPMYSDFQEFWRELAQSFEGISCQPEAVIQQLCNCYQERSVVIAIYGLAHPRRFQAQRAQVINDFWIPLCEKIEALPSHSPSSRLVMFCTGEPDEYSDNQGPLAGNSMLLPSLRAISYQDVEDWLHQDPVYKSFRERRPNTDDFVSKDLIKWPDMPDKVLDELSALFNVDFESYWELDR